MNYKEDSFLIRTYTKAELAHLYNPHVCLKVALQILRRWIIYTGKKLVTCLFGKELHRMP